MNQFKLVDIETGDYRIFQEEAWKILTRQDWYCDCDRRVKFQPFTDHGALCGGNKRYIFTHAFGDDIQDMDTFLKKINHDYQSDIVKKAENIELKMRELKKSDKCWKDFSSMKFDIMRIVGWDFGHKPGKFLDEIDIWFPESSTSIKTKVSSKHLPNTSYRVSLVDDLAEYIRKYVVVVKDPALKGYLSRYGDFSYASNASKKDQLLDFYEEWLLGFPKSETITRTYFMEILHTLQKVSKQLDDYLLYC